MIHLVTLMRLATCDVKGETSASFAVFSMLQEVTNNPNTNSTHLFLFVMRQEKKLMEFKRYRDEKDEGVRNTKSCQFHFKQSIQRMLLKIPAELEDLKNEFEELMTTLLTVATLKEYRDLKLK